MEAFPQTPHQSVAVNDLLRIAARASRLDERLAGLCRPDDGALAGSGPLQAGRLEAWERALTRESEARPAVSLAKRLAWDGLDISAAAAALSPAVWNDPARPPGWLHFLAEAMTAASDREPDGGLNGPKTFVPRRELAAEAPFFDLWQPFLLVAARRLEALAGTTLSWVTPGAAADLAADLIRQLALLGAPAAHEQFAAFRAQQAPIASPAEPDAVSRRVYRAFVHAMLDDRLQAFCAEYSALARQLCLRAEQWAFHVARLLARLNADGAELQATFLDGKPLQKVCAIRPGLSDRHHGGQQVAALEFESGLKLIYKPKNLDQEAAFQGLLRWLLAEGNRSGEAPPIPPAIRVLRRENYGWVQCVEPTACADAEEVDRYYRRAGGLLCLLHALGGNDCHRDNVFATREGPILIDIESLLQPAWRPGAPEAAATASPALGTVLQTGLLPLWKRGSDGEFADDGGFSGQGKRRTHLARKVWRGINTDGMHAAEEPAFTIATSNVPICDGQVRMPHHYAGAVLAGFAECYRFLLKKRAALTAAGGPLGAFRPIDSRLICRPSNLYAKLLRALAADRRYARDGFERSVAIEALARPLLVSTQKPALWPLLAAERLALEEGDVPFFTVAQVAAALGIDPARFAPDFASRLGQLDEADLARQEETIRASLLRPAEVELAEPLARALAAVPAGLQALTDAQFIAEAARLADEIAARAEINERGASWLSPDAMRPGVDGARGAPLFLYGGAPGVALFLAALDRVTGERKNRPLIEAACRPIHSFLESSSFDHWIGREPIGAGLGLGGVVYALTRIGGFLGESAYLETALRVARWILPDRILADTTYDVLSGSAGALLGLLALHEATGEPAALDLALLCGRHLCADAKAAPGPRLAWPTGRSGALLAGFAHGTAGIGYALVRLHAATGGAEPLWLETARAAVAYERALFSPEAGNWPVVASSNDSARQPLFLSTWCHGGPGIALGRVGGLAVRDDADVRQDIRAGLQNLVSRGLTMIDHLCCGNMGRIGIAWTAAHALQQADLGAVARTAASFVVGRAAQAGGVYRLRADETENRFFEAGFFRGVSGIGYGLLRLARPELPCALLFA